MEHIGRYRIEATLGSGAFATVHLGYDETLDARVAVKVLAENWAGNDDFRRRFVDEARILWRAESDHIIKVHAVDDLADGRPYFVMDYADGGTLEARMIAARQSGRVASVDAVADIVDDIAAGLEAAHSLGVVHRDLKPANVMFRTVPGQGDVLVLVDFGIAKSMAGAGTTIATGTPHYMAPEQAEGRVDERTDIYSLAVVAYELLAGQVPYPYDTLPQLIRAQIAGDIAPLHPARADVTPALDAVVRGALATDPAERPATARAFASAFRAAMTDQSAAAPPPPPPADPTPPPPPMDATVAPDEFRAQQQPPPPSGPPPGPPPPPGGTPPPAASPPPKKSKGPLIGAFAAVAALVIAAVGVVALTGSDDGDGPNASELFAEPVSSVGIDQFMPSVGPDATTDGVELAGAAASVLGGLEVPEGELTSLSLPDLDLPTPGGAGVPTILGGAPGLYGGTNQIDVCSKPLLKQFLADNADKATAWADTIGITTSEIDTYVDGLTDVILQVDTRVTNHGFRNGKANPINSVLQAGTAVLVDHLGLPVVRCKCGNPLKAALPLTSAAPTIVGQTWDGFDVDDAVAILPSPEPIVEFVLDDVLADAPLFRLPGATAAESTVQPQLIEPPTPATTTTSSTSTTTTSTTTSTTTTTAPPPPTDLTRGGSVSASSTYSGFSTGASVDGSEGTSWFSAGSNSDGGESTYTWDAGGTVDITSITIVGNGSHSNPSFRTGFGFDSVIVEVRDAGGGVVFSESAGLGGTPDPTVSVQPNVRGTRVVLRFLGHEDPTCGGFSELAVMGRR